MITLAVVCAGALGAPARYAVERAITRRSGHSFPWGTTVVNLVGSFALGVVAGLVEFQGLDHDIAQIAGIGFLGAFTTFSTFAVETNRLTGRLRIQSIVVSLVGGLGLAAPGLALAAL